jgi:hypothetical protein
MSAADRLDVLYDSHTLYVYNESYHKALLCGLWQFRSALIWFSTFRKFLFYFICNTGDKTRALYMLGKHWTIASVLVFLGPDNAMQFSLALNWRSSCLSFVLFCFFFKALGLELRLTPPVLFLWKVFWDRILRSFCPGWLWTVILLISASWVARITGVSHRCLACLSFQVLGL